MHEGVDELLAVAVVTSLHEVGELVLPASGGGVQLEGPQPVGDHLEVLADGEDLMHNVLDTDDSLVAKSLLNQGVVSDGDALLLDLGESTLVDELLDCLQVGVTGKMSKRGMKVKDAVQIQKGVKGIKTNP